MSEKILLNPPTEENTQWIDKYNLRVDLARNMLAIVEIDDYRIALEELDEKGSHTFQQFIENLFKEAAQKTKGMTAVKNAGKPVLPDLILQRRAEYRYCTAAA